MNIDLPGIGQPVNRPLTHEEQRFHLNPKQRVPSEPISMLATIRINSIFLEQVDVFHEYRGFGALISIFFIITISLFNLNFISDLLKSKSITGYISDGDFFLFKLVITMSIFFLIAFTVILFSECFRLTHYPILLNRKTRIVHAFKRNGTILSIPWDNLYLTIKYQRKSYLKEWNLLGYVMDPDGITVRETIVFPTRSNEEAAIRLWEYIRRFMEEGPKDLYDISDQCLPIWDRKEPFNVGLAMWMLNLGFLQMPFFPVLFLAAIGRYIAGLTNKIPVWPQEIMDTCQIEPDDPYARDWRSSSSWWKFGKKVNVEAEKR